jgi:hypothetical protein
VKDLAQMAKQCEALIDTKDVDAWTNGFLIHVTKVVRERGTTVLTNNQVSCLTRIHDQHFAG